MEFQLSSPLQHHIADLMWKATDREQVKDIIKVYGKDAVLVLEMMLAAYYDNVDSTDLAQEVISEIKQGLK